MNRSGFSGSAQITDEGIKKHFKSYEPIDAIFELIWNGLDAGATAVRMSIVYNDLEGLESITILDNGDGIDIKNLKNNFGKFNESSRKHDDDKHGSHGKGRLAFHKLCERAIWYTRREAYNAKIMIQSDAIKDYKGSYLDPDAQYPSLLQLTSGTVVELHNFGNNTLPDEDTLLTRLSKEFGWYLALNKNRQVFVNEAPVLIPNHELHETHFSIDGIDFTAKIIRWDDKPGSEKSYNYLINSQSKVVHKDLSKFNNKIAFHTSAYVASPWIDSYDPNLIEFDPTQQRVYRQVLSQLLEFQRDIYKDFLRRHVQSQIQRFDDNGYFPSYKGVEPHYAEWRKNYTKTVLTDLYIADPSLFSALKPKQKKIIIRLLDKLLVSNENEELLDVLEGVLDLNSDHMAALANQLQKTTLENVVSTIEILQKRQFSIHMLREVMEHRYDEVLETPDLQKVVEANTWLFGAQYTTLGAEEDSFTKMRGIFVKL